MWIKIKKEHLKIMNGCFDVIVVVMYLFTFDPFSMYRKESILDINSFVRRTCLTNAGVKNSLSV